MNCRLFQGKCCGKNIDLQEYEWGGGGGGGITPLWETSQLASINFYLPQAGLGAKKSISKEM